MSIRTLKLTPARFCANQWSRMESSLKSVECGVNLTLCIGLVARSSFSGGSSLAVPSGTVTSRPVRLSGQSSKCFVQVKPCRKYAFGRNVLGLTMMLRGLPRCRKMECDLCMERIDGAAKFEFTETSCFCMTAGAQRPELSELTTRRGLCSARIVVAECRSARCPSQPKRATVTERISANG
jgi:hypothetical protein